MQFLHAVIVKFLNGIMNNWIKHVPNKIYILFICLLLLTCNSKQNIPLFTLLKSSESNIDFNNKIEDELHRNYFLYDNFYGGAGVGVGDFNNDGLDDIYFCSNLESNKL